MIKIALTFIILLALFAGCDEGTNEPSSTPYEQWKAKNIHNYTVEQVRVCFCGDGGVRMKVTVYSDTVFSVVNLSDPAMVPPPISRLYLTVDSLFGFIRYNKSDSLVYSFDAVYRYPNSVDINPQLHPVDGGVLYETSNLTPIQ